MSLLLQTYIRHLLPHPFLKNAVILEAMLGTAAAAAEQYKELVSVSGSKFQSVNTMQHSNLQPRSRLH